MRYLSWARRNCRNLQGYDRSVAGTCKAMTDQLRDFARLWRDQLRELAISCENLQRYGRSVAGTCNQLRELATPWQISCHLQKQITLRRYTERHSGNILNSFHYTPYCGQGKKPHETIPPYFLPDVYTLRSSVLPLASLQSSSRSVHTNVGTGYRMIISLQTCDRRWLT
jgi:hypothetical protein